jgi:glycosyltransferase involved in cell wall biosynthesis
VKIFVLTGTFHPEPGGPPTYLQHLLPALQAQGHEVCVLTYGEPYEQDYGYPVTRISRRSSIPLRLAQFTRAAFRLARWADVWFVQGYTIPLLALRPLLRRRIVTKMVSDFSWEYARRHQLTGLDVNAFQKAAHPPMVRLLRTLYGASTRLADALIVPSEHVAQLARGLGVPSNRIHVILNAVPDSGLAAVARADLRRELGLPLDRPLLVSIGRLTPVKGFDVALRALVGVPDATLVIVGEGEQRAALNELAAPYGDRVCFVGRQPQEMALRYLRAADVFVLSSHTEGLSHVLLEAIAVGTPAVATRVGGNPEILTNGVNGLLVPPDNPPALAAAVCRLLDDPAYAAALAEAGLRRSTDFSWDTVVQRTEALLKPG